MTRITISKYWNNPRIAVNLIVTDKSISVQVSLNSFIRALKQEIGSVTLIVKQNSFEQKVDAAVREVIRKIKEESAKVMV